MKPILSMTALFTLAVLFMSAVSVNQMPQDIPHGKKAQKHINLVRVDDKGNKTELDTTVEAGQVFVWNGDTIGDGKELKWIAEDGEFKFDPDMDIDIDVQDAGKGKVFVMKSGNKTAPMIYEFKTDNDSAQEHRVMVIAPGKGEDMDIMKWHGANGTEMMLPPVPPAPHVMMFRDQKKGNVIDLSDPGIISYEKKELKDGKEKITIIRNKPAENMEEQNEELFMHSPVHGQVIMHGDGPGQTKQIKVISGDDGKIEILEDGKMMHIEDMEEVTKVIEKDGKKIVVKKIKDGDEVKVNVEVEENREEK
jgi:hypothetical protein